MKDNVLGVAIVKCFFCGKDKGLVMNKRLHPAMACRVEQMNGKVIDKEPCEDCKELMKQGIMFCSVRDGEKGDNPYRTGKLCVIKEESLEGLLEPSFLSEIKKSRFAFVEDSMWKRMGFPVEEVTCQ